METDSMRFLWIACNWRQDNPKEKKSCLSYGRKNFSHWKQSNIELTC